MMEMRIIVLYVLKYKYNKVCAYVLLASEYVYALDVLCTDLPNIYE